MYFNTNFSSPLCICMHFFAVDVILFNQLLIVDPPLFVTKLKSYMYV